MLDASTLIGLIGIVLVFWAFSEGFNYLQDKFCDWIEKKIDERKNIKL